MFDSIFDLLEDMIGDIAETEMDEHEVEVQPDLSALASDLDDGDYLVDLDGDGIADAVANDAYLDSDGDGVLDTIVTEIALDTDGDGIADTFETITAMDTDGDGILDTSIEVLDADGDGDFDYGVITVGQDTDGDGVIDVLQIGEDCDGDGVLDSLTDFADIDGDGDLDPLDGSALDGRAPAYENFDPDDSDDDGVIGDPAEAMENWHTQETGTSCAVASQEFVLETLTGRDFTEAELRDLAEQNGWYDPDGGTPMADVGNILEHMGLTVNRSQGNSVSDIEECLENGGEVIVGVDSSELWEGESDDFFGPGMGADHAIQVIGIDRSNPDEPMVIINDSGCTNGCGAMIPLDEFMDAWEDSGCFMVEAYA